MNSICVFCRYKLLSTRSARIRQGPIRGLVSRTRIATAPHVAEHSRLFASKPSLLSEKSNPEPSEFAEYSETRHDLRPLLPLDAEATARRARQKYGDVLPKGQLSSDELRVYERLYGSPVKVVPDLEQLEEDLSGREAEEQGGTTLQTKGIDGVFEDVAVDDTTERLLVDKQRDDEDLEDALSLSVERRKRLQERHENGEQLTADEEEQRLDIAPQFVQKRSIAGVFDILGDLEEEVDAEEDQEEADIWPGDEARLRTHPFTRLGRFCTSPTTVQFPTKSFLEPLKQVIAPATTRQMRNQAESIFGGPGLPYSPGTPRRSRTMEQKPIPLQAGQRNMTDMASYVYCATVMPGVYASVLSVLTEVRKRLGSRWLRDLMAREGGPVVLDAGAGGAGILAWRDIIQAEWEAMQTLDNSDGTLKRHNKAKDPPFGKSSILTASDTLRHRASKLLDNTTFLPRLPEAVDPDGAESRKQYDIIIATHTLWPIDKDHYRKQEVDKLWSLLKPSGGLLVLIEKGVPRGFEVIAGARAHILKQHIADPMELHSQTSHDEDILAPQKEEGMIVAPCTNHAGCPMYPVPGISRGRKDWCHFSQRFIRPPFLQSILGARQVNHDDVEFSYLAVARGIDLRSSVTKQGAPIHNDDMTLKGDFLPVVQGPAATQSAYAGYENSNGRNDPEEDGPVENTSQEQSLLAHPLTLPRLILPPLKRPRHIILDVCTPTGTLERWTVAKGFSRQAYRDARKAAWGDLWALGAKSRSWKRVNLGKKGEGKSAEREERRMGKKIEEFYNPVESEENLFGDGKDVALGRMDPVKKRLEGRRSWRMKLEEQAKRRKTKRERERLSQMDE